MEEENTQSNSNTPISWWKKPRLTKEEVRYIKTIQQVFKASSNGLS